MRMEIFKSIYWKDCSPFHYSRKTLHSSPKYFLFRIANRLHFVPNLTTYLQLHIGLKESICCVMPNGSAKWSGGSEKTTEYYGIKGYIRCHMAVNSLQSHTYEFVYSFKRHFSHFSFAVYFPTRRTNDSFDNFRCLEWLRKTTLVEYFQRRFVGNLFLEF